LTQENKRKEWKGCGGGAPGKRGEIATATGKGEPHQNTAKREEGTEEAGRAFRNEKELKRRMPRKFKGQEDTEGLGEGERVLPKGHVKAKSPR